MSRALLACLLIISLSSLASAQQPSSAAATPHWIWSSHKPSADQTVHFRKTFNIRGRVASARLYATADDAATVYIDGRQALELQGWQKPQFKDVTALFKDERPRGSHVVAVRGTNGKGSAGVLIKLDLDLGRGGPRTIVSDDSWRTSPQAAENWEQTAFDESKWPAAVSVGKLGDKPWTAVNVAALVSAAKLRAPAATPIAQLKIAKGFQVELLYSVPKEVEGSWVSMCTDPQGRLIVCDQNGAMLRRRRCGRTCGGSSKVAPFWPGPSAARNARGAGADGIPWSPAC